MNRDDREREQRLRDAQAAALGIGRAEFERLHDADKALRAKGRTSLRQVGGDIAALVRSWGGEMPPETRACMRCGHEGARLRLDPLNQGPPRGFGLVCTGREDGQGCYEELERLQAEKNGAEYREQTRQADAARAAAPPPEKRRRKPQQQGLPLNREDDQEAPF